MSDRLERVLLAFRLRVRQVGYGHGLRDHDVDELEQEIRIRLWKAGERGENIDALPASYVRKVAVSAATDLLRRRRARRVDETTTLAAAEASGALRSEGETPEGLLEHGELASEIDEALGRLGPTREPVVRMYLAGYSRHEISDLLRWTEAKTRNLLYRGLGDLREELRKGGVYPT
ncbi:MAG TPA: sigma-70 family RNA polymerase sigma factor [Longimicrobiales bacterium]|jgi:RNA polymerase sigma-70 factor (ECF subfamily)